MTLIHTIQELRRELARIKTDGRTIGFVPTMGALHRGHGELIRKSVSECDTTVVSVFVNPIQFGPNEDYSRYPRTLEADCRLAEEMGADYVFAPDTDNMFSGGMNTFVDIEELQNNLCGLKRPGHFRGVCTIVSKLFNIVMPDRAYFGKKDIQQLTILRKMTEDLNFNITIVPCAIVRDSDGLALSSRNKYLSDAERTDALVLNQALKKAAAMIEEGIRSSQTVINMIEDMVKTVSYAQIDYISIVDSRMKDSETAGDGCIIALAVFFGKTRLIDNHVIGDPVCF